MFVTSAGLFAHFTLAQRVANSPETSCRATPETQLLLVHGSGVHLDRSFFGVGPLLFCFCFLPGNPLVENRYSISEVPLKRPPVVRPYLFQGLLPTIVRSSNRIRFPLVSGGFLARFGSLGSEWTWQVPPEFDSVVLSSRFTKGRLIALLIRVSRGWSHTYPLKLQGLGKLICYRHIAHVTPKKLKSCFLKR